MGFTQRGRPLTGLAEFNRFRARCRAASFSLEGLLHLLPLYLPDGSPRDGELRAVGLLVLPSYSIVSGHGGVARGSGAAAAALCGSQRQASCDTQPIFCIRNMHYGEASRRRRGVDGGMFRNGQRRH